MIIKKVYVNIDVGGGGVKHSSRYAHMGGVGSKSGLFFVRVNNGRPLNNCPIATVRSGLYLISLPDRNPKNAFDPNWNLAFLARNLASSGSDS